MSLAEAFDEGWAYLAQKEIEHKADKALEKGEITQEEHDKEYKRAKSQFYNDIAEASLHRSFMQD